MGSSRRRFEGKKKKKKISDPRIWYRGRRDPTPWEDKGRRSHRLYDEKDDDPEKSLGCTTTSYYEESLSVETRLFSSCRGKMEVCRTPVDYRL